jgi:hypothetical protein
MKVWIIEEGSYSDRRVVGVATTYELAIEIAKKHRADEDDIKEWETDDVPFQPPGMEWWSVRMTRDGDVLLTWDSPAAAASSLTEHWTESVHMEWNVLSLGIRALEAGKRQTTHTLRSINFHHWAQDEAHAVKTANEHRTWLAAKNMLPFEQNDEAHKRLERFIELKKIGGQ